MIAVSFCICPFNGSSWIAPQSCVINSISTDCDIFPCRKTSYAVLHFNWIIRCWFAPCFFVISTCIPLWHTDVNSSTARNRRHSHSRVSVRIHWSGKIGDIFTWWDCIVQSMPGIYFFDRLWSCLYLVDILCPHWQSDWSSKSIHMWEPDHHYILRILAHRWKEEKHADYRLNSGSRPNSYNLMYNFYSRC